MAKSKAGRPATKKGGAKKGGAKKAKLTKASTMMATAQDAMDYLYPSKGFIGTYLKDNEKAALKSHGVTLPDRATPCKKGAAKTKPALKRDSTMAKTVAEAKQLLDGGVDVTKGRTTRTKKAPAKPALKRAGTMQKTANEGQSFLKRGKGKKGKGKK